MAVASNLPSIDRTTSNIHLSGLTSWVNSIKMNLSKKEYFFTSEVIDQLNLFDVISSMIRRVYVAFRFQIDPLK